MDPNTQANSEVQVPNAPLQPNTVIQPSPTPPPIPAPTPVAPTPPVPVQVIATAAISVNDPAPMPAQSLFQPQASPFTPPTKKRSKLWLWLVLGVVFLIALIAGGFVLFSSLKKPAVKDSANSSSVAESTIIDFPLNKDITTVQDPAWLFPGSIDGWDITLFNQNGVNKLSKKGSQTTFTSYQLLSEGIDVSDDKSATEIYQDAIIDGTKTKATVEVTSDTTMTFTTFVGDKSVEFSVRDYLYKTAAGDYQARLVTRVTDKHILSLIYAGLESEFSESEWALLTKSIQIEATFSE